MISLCGRGGRAPDHRLAKLLVRAVRPPRESRQSACAQRTAATCVKLICANQLSAQGHQSATTAQRMFRLADPLRREWPDFDQMADPRPRSEGHTLTQSTTALCHASTRPGPVADSSITRRSTLVWVALVGPDAVAPSSRVRCLVLYRSEWSARARRSVARGRHGRGLDDTGSSTCALRPARSVLAA